MSKQTIVVACLFIVYRVAVLALAVVCALNQLWALALVMVLFAALSSLKVTL